MAGLRKTLRRHLRRNKTNRPPKRRQSFSTEPSPCSYRYSLRSTPHLIAKGHASDQSEPSVIHQVLTQAQTNHEASTQQVPESLYHELPYFQDLPPQYHPRPEIEGRDSGSNYSNSIAELDPDTMLLVSSPATSALAINCLATKQDSEADLNQTGKASCALCMESVPLGKIVKRMPCQHW